MHGSLETVDRLERADVIWEALAWPGYEHLCLEEWSGDGGFTIDGLVVAVLDDRPSRTWYRIEADEEWSFKSLRLFHTPEFSNFDDGPLDMGGLSIELTRSSTGRWDHDLGDLGADLSGCTGIDIAVTPFTNTLAIRSQNLSIGESANIEVVYVAVPEMTLAPASQRYSRLDTHRYRYESLTSGFTTELEVDEHGLVTDYPGLFRRVWPE